MALTRVLRVVGLVLVGAGVLVLLFTAFQLWGTGIFEAHSQNQLRSSLQNELPPAARRQAATHDLTVPPTTDPGPPRTAVPAAPPPAGKAVGVIQIPSIGLNQVVVEGVGEADLRLGPGHYPGTPLPGERGNSAVAGHRTTYGHPFYNLNAVPVGAPVTIVTRQGIFVYRTQWLRVVSPSDSAVLDASTSPLLTLTTCNPRYSASQRLVLRAVLVRSRLTGAGTHGPAPPTTHPTANELAGGVWVATGCPSCCGDSWRPPSAPPLWCWPTGPGGAGPSTWVARWCCWWCSSSSSPA